MSKNFRYLTAFLFLAYQRSVSNVGPIKSPVELDVFAKTIVLTQLSSPNTSSSNARTRCTFSSPICTKIEPLSVNKSRATINLSRR
ncbi:Uncharacterised protein [Bordetella pertussis]|nr:Uncharacterised protein [Bordetella pertussis]